MSDQKQRVVVLGASTNAERFSHMAVVSLLEQGHEVVPINPAASTIAELPVVPALDRVSGDVDTITMYVSAKISTGMEDDIAALNPKRVIFNPGAENQDLQTKLETRGINVLEACTLVLITTGQF